MEKRKEVRRRKEVVFVKTEKPKIEKMLCKCRKQVDVKIYTDGWYVGAHDDRSECRYWECGFK